MAATEEAVANALALGKPVEQEFQTEEMVTVSMGDVNGCEIPAALGDPIY